MKIKIAIALSEEKTLENQHFGDADKFLLVETDGKEFKEVGEEENPFKGEHGHGHHGAHAHEHSHEHGKGQGKHRKVRKIIAFLQEREVQALVSRQFGKNIREICAHFVPVLVTEKFVEPSLELIHTHFEKLSEERNRQEGLHDILRLKGDDCIAIPLKEDS